MHIIAPVVKIISYCLTLTLNFYQIRQGVVTSGLLFTFWFFQTVCGGITFRSVLSTDYVSGNDRILPFTNYVIQYPFIVAMFFLNCFADAKPNFVNADGTYSALFTFYENQNLFGGIISEILNNFPKFTLAKNLNIILVT